MEELNNLAKSVPTLWQGILLTIVGFTLYLVMDIISKKNIKTIKEVWTSGYIQGNSLMIVITMIVSGAIFAASYWSGTMDIERCLGIGVITTVVLNKFFNRS